MEAEFLQIFNLRQAIRNQKEFIQDQLDRAKGDHDQLKLQYAELLRNRRSLVARITTVDKAIAQLRQVHSSNELRRP